MLPVGYEAHCQSCHPLAFDERILEEAPHEDPEVVEAFVRTLFFEYAGDRPNELRRPQAPHPARQLSSLKKLVEEAPRTCQAGSGKRWILLSHSCLRKSTKNATR